MQVNNGALHMPHYSLPPHAKGHGGYHPYAISFPAALKQVTSK